MEKLKTILGLVFGFLLIAAAIGVKVYRPDFPDGGAAAVGLAGFLIAKTSLMD